MGILSGFSTGFSSGFSGAPKEGFFLPPEMTMPELLDVGRKPTGNVDLGENPLGIEFAHLCRSFSDDVASAHPCVTNTGYPAVTPEGLLFDGTQIIASDAGGCSGFPQVCFGRFQVNVAGVGATLPITTGRYSTNYGRGFGFNVGWGRVYGQINFGAQVSMNPSVTPFPVLGAFYTVVLIARDATTNEMYVDGKRYTTSDDASNNGGDFTRTDSLIIGGAPTGSPVGGFCPDISNPYDGVVEFGGWASKGWSAAEVYEFSKNPYQFLKPAGSTAAPIFMEDENKPDGFFVPTIPEMLDQGRKPVGNVEIDRATPLGPFVSDTYVNQAFSPTRNLGQGLFPKSFAPLGTSQTFKGPMSYEGLQSGFDTSLRPLVPPFTMHCRFYRQGAWGGDLSTIFGFLGAAGTQVTVEAGKYGHRVRVRTEYVGFALTSYQDGEGFVVVTSGTGGHDIPADMFIVCKATNDWEVRFYFDGKRGEITTSSVDIPLNVGYSSFCYGSVGVGVGVPVEIGSHFTKALNMAETDSLAADPYQFLKPVAGTTQQSIVYLRDLMAPPLPTQFIVGDGRVQAPEMLENRKPVGNVEIDWGSPLTSGLTSFNLMRSDIDDLVTGGRLLRDVQYSRHEVKNSQESLFIQQTGTGSLVTVDKRVLTDGVPHTMLCCVSMDTVASTGVNGFYTEADSTGHHILRTLSATSFEFLINGLTNDRVSHTFSPTNGKPFVAGGSWAGSGSPLNVITYDETNKLKRTINGASSTGTFQAGNPTYSSADGWAGASHSNYYWFACWERVLTDVEIDHFIRDPYQFLKPKTPPFLQNIKNDDEFVLPDARHEAPEMFDGNQPVDITVASEDPRLLHYYPLTGCASDIVAGKNGSLQGTTKFGVSGGYFGAIFDGAAGSILLDSPLVLNADDFTMSFWLYIPSYINYEYFRILGDTVNGWNCLYVRVLPTNLISVYGRMNSVDLLTYSGTSTIAPSEWMHIAVVRDNHVMKVYHNGVDISAGVTLTGSDVFTPSNTHIGKLQTGYSVQTLRDLGVYRRALSQSEIVRVYQDPYQFLVPA